ncbi:RidA family protein [Flavobacterium franklandianum]|uniref:RidA family protein n=1 Tax=Flavobacterium franklandianum TaxID=2594430 RepID=A0A553CJ00_9FLAO|nr:RidA family protein [Flavobacterium franklandianum]TRX20475.1 RidA family protein [Flavobacterium franklandianum]TRX24812.1 RidA family protein [Flavobacterium franklandianum]
MKTIKFLVLGSVTLLLATSIVSCVQKEPATPNKPIVQSETPEYFLLRPEVEKAYGYSHAVKIGNDIKISGAVSMDDKGNLTAPGSMDQQMKNCYADLEKILKHYGCTFDDVVVENVFTTNMAEFMTVSGFRNSVYKKQFPTGTWLEVKGLALPGQLIEIDMEVHLTK